MKILWFLRQNNKLLSFGYTYLSNQIYLGYDFDKAPYTNRLTAIYDVRFFFIPYNYVIFFTFAIDAYAI